MGESSETMAIAPSLFGHESEMPQVSHSLKQRILKGEDTTVAAPVRLRGGDTLEFQVFAVFDGHNGNRTAAFCKQCVVEELLQHLPDTPMPSEDNVSAFEAYLQKLREALLDTFLTLNRKSIAANCNSGCTATVMVVTGWLATIANVGDSALIMHSASGTQQLTADHRLDTNPSECRRLESNGYILARLRADFAGPAMDGNGVGPLRAWPGSLMMARAIGDQDAGIGVMPYPHICQIRIPHTGARFIAASDGLWDSNLSMRSIISLAQRLPLEKLADRLARDAVQSTGLIDDTSVMCIDVVPASMPDIRDSLSSAPGPSFTKRLTGAMRALCCVGPPLTNEDPHLYQYFCKVHTDQVVESKELESTNRDYGLFTRTISTSRLLTSPPSSFKSPSEHRQSVDGPASCEGGRMRVLSRCDTAASLNVPAGIREEHLAQKEGDDDEGNGSDNPPLDPHDALPIRVSIMGPNSIQEMDLPERGDQQEGAHPPLEVLDSLSIIVDVDGRPNDSR